MSHDIPALNDPGGCFRGILREEIPSLTDRQCTHAKSPVPRRSAAGLGQARG